MSTDIKNSILIKLYNQYFENYVIGINRNTLESEFSNGNPNEVRIILNELASNFLISFENGSYKITAFGIKYLEEEELVEDSNQHQRNEILKILKDPYKEDVDKNTSHEIILEKLNLSKPIEILSQMKYLKDEGYLHLELALGGYFSTRLTHAGYELAKSLS